MPRTIPFQAMLDHAYNPKTLAEWVVVGGIGMTSHIDDVSAGGTTCRAQLGFVRGSFRESLEQHLSTVSFQAYFHPTGITRAAVVGKSLEGADATFGVCDYAGGGSATLLRGWVGRITIRDHGYEMELRSMLDRFNQQVGQTVSPSNVGQFLPGMNAISNP